MKQWPSVALSIFAALLMGFNVSGGEPDGQVAFLAVFDRAMCAGLICFIVCNLVFRIPRSLRHLSSLPRFKWFLGLGVLLVLIVRMVEPPILLHPDQGGALNMFWALDITRISMERVAYGQGGILTQGLIAHLLGGDLRAFVTGNILLSVAAIGLIAMLVGRWTGSSFAAPLAVLVLAAFNPILVRTAASEDVHTVGAFYGILAIWSMERFLTERRLEDLYLAVPACILSMCSRQFLILMPLLIVLLFIERRGWRAAAPKRVIPAGVVLLLCAGIYLMTITALTSAAPYYKQFGGFDSVWSAFVFYLRWQLPYLISEPYPLADQSVFPLPLLLLLLFGLTSFIRKGPTPRTLVLAWLMLALLAIGPAFWGIEHRYLFRSLFMYANCLVVGLGWGKLFAWIKARWSGWLPQTAFVACSVILPVAMSVPDILRRAEQNAFTREFLFVEESLKKLPPQFTLVYASREDLKATNLTPGFIEEFIKRSRENVVFLSLSEWRKRSRAERFKEPVLWYKGGICNVVSVFELRPEWRNPMHYKYSDNLGSLLEILNAKAPTTEWILEKRRGCNLTEASTEPFRGLAATITPPAVQEEGYFYVRTTFKVGFYRLRVREALTGKSPEKSAGTARNK